MNALLAEPVQKRAHFSFKLRPGGTECVQIGISGWRKHAPGRLALPAQEPDGFGGIHMDKRVAKRSKTAFEILNVLLRRDLVDGFQNSISSPIVVVQQYLQFLKLHKYREIGERGV